MLETHNKNIKSRSTGLDRCYTAALYVGRYVSKLLGNKRDY